MDGWGFHGDRVMWDGDGAGVRLDVEGWGMVGDVGGDWRCCGIDDDGEGLWIWDVGGSDG